MQHERFLYQAATYENGKKRGSTMPFDSFMQAEDHLGHRDCANPDWPKPKILRVRWNERVPPDADGIVVEEMRMKYGPDLPFSGVRIYA